MMSSLFEKIGALAGGDPIKRQQKEAQRLLHDTLAEYHPARSPGPVPARIRADHRLLQARDLHEESRREVTRRLTATLATYGQNILFGRTGPRADGARSNDPWLESQVPLEAEALQIIQGWIETIAYNPMAMERFSYHSPQLQEMTGWVLLLGQVAVQLGNIHFLRGEYKDALESLHRAGGNFAVFVYSPFREESETLGTYERYEDLKNSLRELYIPQPMTQVGPFWWLRPGQLVSRISTAMYMLGETYYFRAIESKNRDDAELSTRYLGLSLEIDTWRESEIGVDLNITRRFIQMAAELPETWS